MSNVTCQTSHVTCHISHVTFHMSHLISLFFFVLFFLISCESLSSKSPQNKCESEIGRGMSKKVDALIWLEISHKTKILWSDSEDGRNVLTFS